MTYNKKLTNRLITSGCSYTQYCWPTWADYLGQQFDKHVQLGQSGIDCARIARSIVSCKDLTPTDLVVICWTGFDRFNYMKDSVWIKTGSVTSDKYFFTHYYHAEERFAVMLDAMLLVDLHSRHIGYQAFHFSAFPWLLGEVEKQASSTNQIMSQTSSVKNLYMEQDLESFKLGIQDPLTSHKYNDRDDHPTPDCHYRWLKQIMLPKLAIDVSIDLEQKVRLDQARVLTGDVN